MEYTNLFESFDKLYKKLNEENLEKDSLGNTLTQEQSNYFKDSKIRDNEGHLLVLYHGSPSKGINEFSIVSKEGTPTSFFTQNKSYAKEYVSNRDDDSLGKIYNVYLNITKPFDIDKEECKKIAETILGHPITKKTVEDTDKLFKELRNNSKYDYDGIIAGEELSPKQINKYGNSSNTSYVPFYPNQIKLINNFNPTNSNRINESKEDIDKFISWAGKDLADRFFIQKDRLTGKDRDIYTWIGKEKSVGKDKAINELDAKLKELESKPTNKEKVSIAKEGAKKIYSDNKWDVYNITTPEAANKYGKDTKWCITGNNVGNNDLDGKAFFDSYVEHGAEFYYFIPKYKKDKFCLRFDNMNDWELWNATDYIEVASAQDELYDTWNPIDTGGRHLDFPNIKGLPNINKAYQDLADKFNYEDKLILE